MKRVIRCLIFLGCFGLFVMMSRAYAKAADFGEDNGNGTVTVTHDNDENIKTKLVVQKDEAGSKQYSYDLGNGTTVINIPLSLGNGTYKLYVCELLTGTRYSVVKSQTITLSLDDETEVYMQASVIVNFKLTDKVVTKSNSLTKRAKTEDAVVKALYKYIVKYYTYDYDKAAKVEAKTISSGYIPDVNEIYRLKKGICYDYSVLFAAMCRSQGIACRLIKGKCNPVKAYHAWNQVYDSEEEEWYTVDTTSDAAYYRAGVSYEMVKDEDDYHTVEYIY